MQARVKRKPVIGLTGGIGAGKTRVAREFEALGCAVIDADELSRRAFERAEVRNTLAEWWGGRVLDESRQLDRGTVAGIVFHDPQELRRLEQLIHPLVHVSRRALHDRYQADPSVKAIVEDCPLLMEVGLDRDCGAVIFVDALRAVRLQRLGAARGWTDRDLLRREKNQLPLDKKAERADYVIVNNADEADISSQVRGVFSQILQKCARRNGGSDR